MYLFHIDHNKIEFNGKGRSQWMIQTQTEAEKTVRASKCQNLSFYPQVNTDSEGPSLEVQQVPANAGAWA